MTPTDQYADWDSAYVLGALAPAERDEYERHLAGCADCRAAVGELAGLPGLLGALPADEALALVDPDDAGSEDAARGSDAARPAATTGGAVASPGLGPTVPLGPLVERVRRGRRRRRLAAVVGACAGVAAVVALLLAVVVPGLRAPQEVDVTFATTAQAQGAPLSASAQLAARDGGTRISSTCSYGSSGYGDVDGGGPARVFGLYVTDADGAVEQVSSWTAAPGDTIEATGWTDLPLGAIAELDIREVGAPDALLRAPMP
ncbi:conserved hypothetical protein [Beutenbergia cavernae DSM 12333]|uniref:Putative zinc-finger domain-containing protein n=1 Tax=Beutenbergia cavernae (strain ATCC BAA-8 / DSM 12333 / CCUG 43141 / JCM 11478 / NBRC 16432 / NCIMB 13614 / HKI 0122) TaxID=471853 RepID=C5BVS1_BEUC1|nr:zf-HC2 domain-containing protein [Beutenbergia cavernae]ACQ78511.1 conserved hypothetical protein [Beutenbergia cavernae DSM 12333]